MLPTWIYLAVALAIALIALGIGQIVPGLGMIFAALAAMMWTAYSAARHKRLAQGR